MQTPDTFDNSRKFIFSNWTNEDFEGTWAGEKSIIKKGETKEFEMFLAFHFAKHLVDREMTKDGKSNLLGVPEERATYEDKTITEIVAGTDSPALAALKAQIRAEIEEDAREEATESVDVKEAPKSKAKKTTKKESKEFPELE